MTHAFNTEEGREWLKTHLTMGPMEVTFTKKDGTERVMNCTLKEDMILPYETKTEKIKAANTDILAVYDIEKESWRSFRLDSITKVKISLFNL